MALTEDKVRSLVADDDELADALAAVHEAASDGTVAWADVNDQISSGHWGRLIERGVLTEDGDGFRLADPAAVEAALGDADGGSVEASTSSDDGDTPDSSWSTWDKIAGLAALGLFAGYSLKQVRAVIGGAVDLLLGPINQVVPFHVVVLIIAVITGVVTTIIQSSLMNQEKMAMYQERMQDIQQRRKDAKERGDDEALERIQEEQMEAMGDQAGMMKEQFRPTVWVMLITIPFFLWIYWNVIDGHIAAADQSIVVPLVGETGWRNGVAGPLRMWIAWYFLCSMAFSNIIRKSMNIDISPT